MFLLCYFLCNFVFFVILFFVKSECFVLAIWQFNLVNSFGFIRSCTTTHPQNGQWQRGAITYACARIAGRYWLGLTFHVMESHLFIAQSLILPNSCRRGWHGRLSSDDAHYLRWRHTDWASSVWISRWWIGIRWQLASTAIEFFVIAQNSQLIHIGSICTLLFCLILAHHLMSVVVQLEYRHLWNRDSTSRIVMLYYIVYGSHVLSRYI